MSRRPRPGPFRVKTHRNYSIADAARLLGVHGNTVRAWLAGGLRSFQVGREHYMLGSELRTFLLERTRKRRVTTPAGQIFCMKCRAPREPAEGMVEACEHAGPALNLRALCGFCGSLMHRRVNAAKLPEAGFADLLNAGGLAPRR